MFTPIHLPSFRLLRLLRLLRFGGALALLLSALPITAATPAKKDTRLYSPEEVRADLREMYQQLQASHFDLFARRPKAEYDARFEQTLRLLDRPMSLFEVEVAFEKFAAFGRVAHARVDFPAADFAAYREADGKILPLFVRVSEGGAVYVTKYLGGDDKIHPGDELLKFEGLTAAELLARLGANISADNDYLAHTQLETRFPAFVWLEWGKKTEFRLQLRRDQGRPFEVLVPARTRPEMQAAEKALPPSFELDWDRREARMLEGGIAYLRPGPFYDNRPDAANPWDPAAFKAFLDQAFTDFFAAGAKKLLVDLRANPGGDNSFSDPLIAYFATKDFSFTADFRIKVSPATIGSNRRRLEVDKDPDSTSHRLAAAYAGHQSGEIVSFPIPTVAPRAGKRFTGDVYLLIDRHSYSNTANVAALVQDYGFGKILGEETSDLATTYGAMEQFELTHTGITVGYPKAQILRPSGSTEARGVVPDIAIRSNLVATAKDEVLEQALALVRQR